MQIGMKWTGQGREGRLSRLEGRMKVSEEGRCYRIEGNN
jgi:hypothetical protein